MNDTHGYHDVPTPSEHAESQARQALLRNALSVVPPNLQESIGQATLGSPELFEHVVINCQGDQTLANLFIEEDRLKHQLDDPQYDRSTIETELAQTQAEIRERQEKLNHYDEL